MKDARVLSDKITSLKDFSCAIERSWYIRSMSTPRVSITMPDDLASCHALIEQLSLAIESQATTIEQLQADLAVARAQAMQRAFRNHSERYLKNSDQLRLDFGDADDAADAASGLADAIEEQGHTVREHTRRPRRKVRNETLPADLPRYEVELPAPQDVQCCQAHGQRTLIGYDTIETLEYIPGVLRVRVTKIPKFACADQPACGVASPERPPGLVEGNRYDTSVATEIIAAKYGYHLPVYRQQDLFAGSGWAPCRSTLLNILSAAAVVIRPLIEFFKQIVLGSEIVGTDDTRVTLLLPATIPESHPDDPRSQRIHEVFSKAVAEGRRSVSARMWAYRSVTVPLNLFDCTVSRHRDGPAEMLANFRGTLLADCYAGYEGIALRSNGDILRAACVAHARRKVFDARQTYPVQASVVLAKFQQLYDIEDRAKTLTVEDRLTLRREDAAAVWADLDAWRNSAAAKEVLGSSNFGQALGYLSNHWSELQTYLTDGRVPIDNNDTEQLMKQVAVGRKNWLFIGSVAAGQRAADLLTLVSSALRNDLDVWAYTKDTLDRLLAGDTDYAAMRPDVWRQAHPEAVREYRVAERRDRADRKQARRAARRVPSRS